MTQPEAEPRRINSGPGVVLLVVYVLFAVSAGARALFQIAAQFSVAPLAYLLSAFSAAVYVVAAVAIGRRRRATALVAVWIELVGVVAIGAFTLLAPQDFADATVWSDFGAGYGFVPLVLPVLGLLWLRHVSGSGGDSPQNQTHGHGVTTAPCGRTRTSVPEGARFVKCWW